MKSSNNHRFIHRYVENSSYIISLPQLIYNNEHQTIDLLA